MPQVVSADATMASTSCLVLASVWTKRKMSAPNSSRQALATRSPLVVVDLGHQHPGALGGEAAHDTPPDAVTAARDDRHLVAQSIRAIAVPP